MFPATEPPPTPLPMSTDDIPLGAAPFETTRHHLASYLIHLVLDRDVADLKGGIYVMRGLRREKGIVDPETGKTQWAVDLLK
ncbi:hypothetical protein B0H10DRAFT_512639 [Mycena sp. CBHHK59/15]|nr:hypothetical protein B0H10DRAFT_512639 [Mycena sp. CBHHK59/15]